MRVRDPYGQEGTVTDTLNGLLEACEKGHLGPRTLMSRLMQQTSDQQAIDNWYSAQEHPPQTPKNGIWYAVTLDNGDLVLVGAEDAVVLEGSG